MPASSVNKRPPSRHPGVRAAVRGRVFAVARVSDDAYRRARVKKRATPSAIASLLLVASIVFLVSGVVARFLRDEERARGHERETAGARAPASSPSDSASPESTVPKSGDDGGPGAHRDGEMGVARSSELMESSPGLLIEGRVLDAGGQPVDGATVGLELHPDSRRVELVEGDPRSPSTSVRTAADGRFAFQGDAPNRADVWITLLAQAAGQAPHLVQHAFESEWSRIDVGDLPLLSGGGLSGRVTDASGSPLPRAAVLLQPAFGHPLERWNDRSELLRPASTDVAGFYEFSNLMPGAYRVTANAPGMQDGTLREAALVEDGRDVEVGPIRLAPGLELTGRVVAPDDAPVPAARVRVRGSSSGTPLDRRIAADANGRFRLEHLPPGALTLEASAFGFSTATGVVVDAATSREEVVLRLGSGLFVRGVVVDAATGAPLGRYAASLRALGPAELATSDATARLLRRRIAALRDRSRPAGDPAARANDESVALELEARLQALDAGPGAGAPRRASAATAPLADHPNGTFEFAGLDEGSYVVEVASGDHCPAGSAPIEVRCGAPAPELRIEVARGIVVGGTIVSKEDGAPLAGATVDLVVVDEIAAAGSDARDSKGSPYSWAFAPAGAHGVVVASAASDGRGRFEIRSAAPGRYFLSASHERTSREKTEPFDLRGDRVDLRIALPAAASLRGHVRNIPAGLERDVAVVAVGGSLCLRTVKVASDGAYRLERMQPGSWVVRAVLAGGTDAIDRKVAALFEDERTPTPPDLTLAAGESKELDLALELPAVGRVEGSVLINGQPAPGFQVILRPADGAAASARVTSRSIPDARGEFALRSVAPGDYTFHVYSTSSRQELHRQSLAVAADTATRVDAQVSVGGLRGHVEASDDASHEPLDGTLTLLPGATAAPEDVRRYAQTHRVHTVRIRGGVFQIEHLTPGVALAILQMRGREPTESSIEIPVRATADVVLQAGKSR